MRNLRDELDRRPLWGAFIGSNSALAAELMAQTGFDWLVIDLQHAPTGGSEQLAAMLRATGSTPTLVRIPGKTDYGTAMAALDAGAQGLIVPMLDTPEEAGLSWRAGNAVLHELSERVLKSCHRAGKLAIAHTAEPGDARHWGGLGFDMVTATSDTRLISVSAASAVEKLRAGNGRAG